jgi:exopolysaccharide biosynthesis protein
MNLETEGFKSLPANERTSRTVVGITPEGVVKLIVVERPTGLSLPALANLMQGMGLSEALNLDGGSSSQMVVQGQVVYSAVIGGRGAPVSTSLVFTPKKAKP